MFEFHLSVNTVHGEYQFYDRQVFSTQEMSMVGQMLRAFGKPTHEDLEVDPKELIGKTCRIKVKYLNANSYTQLKIDEWLPAV